MRRAVLVAALLVPAVAHANGRFPQTVDVHFEPGNDNTIALGVSFGLITSKDGGQTWQWNCEDAIGFGGIYDPDYAFTQSGLLLATTTSMDGLRMTRDLCDWQPAPQPLGPADSTTPGLQVSQVEVGADGVIYAQASDYRDQQLYVSNNDGVSYTARSLPGGQPVDWWESMLVAPSTTGATTRIYLSGYDLPNGSKVRFMFRSDDAGATWTPLPTTAFTYAASSDLQIVAVSPTDPDLVFARVTHVGAMGVGDDLYRSANAGATWTRVVQSTQNITAVVVRRNGDVLYAERPSSPGLPNPGPVHTSHDGGQNFDAGTTGKEIECFTERDDGTLFACGNSFDPDDMALGSGSPDAWTSLLTFSKMSAPVSCSAGTPQHDICEAQRWPTLVCQFGISYPGVTCATGDGGTPDAGIVSPPKGTCGDCNAGSGGGVALSMLVLIGITRRRRPARR